jgi:CRP-like cAMP-binding protein
MELKSMETADIDAIPMFAALSPDDRVRLASAARSAWFSEQQVVVNEGEFAFDFYAIKQGAAEVRRGGEHVADLRPGDVFGEFGVVPGDPWHWTRRRGASVIAIMPTEAIVIDGTHFRRLLEEIPALRDAITATSAARDPNRPA